MADSPNYANTNMNGLANAADGGWGLIGDPTQTASDSPDDWKSFTWYQIEAAVLGGAQMTSSAEQTQALAVADPTTLVEAADTFALVQNYLQSVGDDLVNQANSLAGQSGSPWQGAAADDFVAMIQNFANSIYANVSVLQAASGVSLPDQLMNNANMLSWAQFQISWLDNYYANWAKANGGSVASNGDVDVTSVPGLVTTMTNEMLQVIGALATNYSDNIYPTAVVPPPVNPASPNANGNGNTNSPNLNLNFPNFNLNIPNFNFNTPNANVPNANVPNADLLNTNLNGLPNGLANGLPNGLNLNGLGANVPSPALPNPNTGSVDLANPNLTSTNLGSSNLTPNGPATDLAVPSPNLTSPNLGDIPPTVPALALSSPNVLPDTALSNLSALNPAMDEALNPQTTSPDLTSAVPGAADDEAPLPPDETVPSDLLSSPGSDVGDDGVTTPFLPGMGAPGAGAPTLTSEPSDASGLLGGTTPFAAGSAPLTSDEVGSDTGAAAGDGVPFLPGMGAPGAGAPTSGSEPSDASGLLGGTTPFAADSSPLTSDEVGSDTGAAAGDGVPFLPGMGAPGAGAPTSGSEPSDASGLLGGTTPFAADSSPLTSDELGSDAGAAPVADQSAAAGDEVPFLPGMGAPGAGAPTSGSEPSDASGLLGAEYEPWTELETDDEIGATDGAQRGSAEAASGVDVAIEPVGRQVPQAAAAIDDGEDADSSEQFLAGVESWDGGDGAPSAESAPGDGAASADVVHADWSEAVEAPDGAAGQPAEPAADPAGGQGQEHAEGAGRAPTIDPANDSDDGLSGWDLAGAAADAALFTLGAWATRRRRDDSDDEDFDGVSTEDEAAWLGQGVESSDVEDYEDDEFVANVWRPNRSQPGAAVDGVALVPGARLLRVARPGPADAGAVPGEAEGAEEAEEAERVEALEEEAKKKERSTADLLTQDPGMWGAARPDWDAL